MKNVKRELRQAFEALLTYYQLILSAALIATLVLIVYANDFGLLANEALQNESLSYVLLMPFLAGFVFYMKKDIIKASTNLQECKKSTKTSYVDEITGASLCLVALLVYWYGSYTFYPLEYHLLSLPIFLAGIILALLNLKALITLILPLLFLLFIVPLPTGLMYAIGGSMANFNTQASYTLLKTLGIPVTLSSAYGPPTIVLTASTGLPVPFAIDLPCSGLYSLTAFSMFAAFLAFVASASYLKKIAIVPLGFFLFGVLNIIRITATISIASWFGEQTAMTLFHTVAGLLFIFIGMLLTLFLAERFLKIKIFVTSPEQPACPDCKKSLTNLSNFCLNCGKLLNQSKTKVSKTFFAKIALLLLGCSLVVLSINAPTFVIAQGPIAVTSTSNWENSTAILPQIADYRLTYLYRDTEYEKISRQDAALWYSYSQVNDSRSVIYVGIGVASSISNLHNWEVCLITWQTAQGQYPLVSVLDSTDIQLLQDVPLIARYLVFIDPQYNRTQITLYWYEKATFNTGLTVEQKYVRISLIILAQNATSYRDSEGKLLTAGQSIAAYWEPLKNSSLISLGIPAQQSLLAVSIAFVALTKITQQTNEWRKKRNNQKIFDKIAPPKEKQALQTILDLAKNKKAMETRDINEAIKARTGKTVKVEKLLNVLNRLEEYGFIRKDILIIKNQPKLVWKAKY